MNFRSLSLRFCTLKCGLLLTFGFGAIAAAQTPPTGAGTATATLDADKMRQTVHAQVQKLSDADKCREGREALIAGAGSGAPGGAGALLAGYLDSYAAEVNQQLLPLVTADDVRVRLNVAIVAAQVAAKVDNARMLPVTLALLNDKSDAVVMWALKSARYVLPSLLQGSSPQQTQQLINAIRNQGASERNPALLPLVFEGLSLNYQTARVPGPIFTKMVSQTVPEVLTLLAMTSEQFRTRMPAEPMAFAPASGFLTSRNVWLAQSPQQSLQTIQLLLNIASYAAHRADASSGPDKDLLVQAVVQASKAIVAASISLGPTGQSVGPALAPVNSIQPGAAAGTTSLGSLVDAAIPALRSVPQWATLRTPAGIENVGAPVTAQPVKSAPAARSGMPAAAAATK